MMTSRTLARISARSSTRSSGFTLIELLIAASIMGIVVALSIEPLRIVTAEMLRTREDANDAVKNLAFLENLRRDVRRSHGILKANSEEIVLIPASGSDTVVWRISAEGAGRVTGGISTSFRFSAKSLIVAPRMDATQPTPQPIRYMILRGDFKGLGTLEWGMAVRVESDTRP